MPVGKAVQRVENKLCKLYATAPNIIRRPCGTNRPALRNPWAGPISGPIRIGPSDSSYRRCPCYVWERFGSD